MKILLLILVFSLLELVSSIEQHLFSSLFDDIKLYGTIIVVFKKTVSNSDIQAHFDFLTSSSIPIKHRYNCSSFRGYSTYKTAKLQILLKASDLIDYTELDRTVKLQETQYFPPWGLARISHREFGFTSRYTFNYHANVGEGVKVYVVDSGIRITHLDFEDRATWGKTIPENQPDVDNFGHGTHVAGTIAGKTFGVAKKANLTAVKAFDATGSGSLGDILAALEFVWQDYVYYPSPKGAVVNLSFITSFSRALNEIVNLLSATTGLYVVVAAGNSGDDACRYSPASASRVFSVAASTYYDDRSAFSNYGACVTLFAPGEDIESASNSSDSGSVFHSGTSMATPHVSGVIASLLSLGLGGSNYTSMRSLIESNATRNKIKSPMNTSNLLLWSFPPE